MLYDVVAQEVSPSVGLVMMGLGLQPFEILNISSVQDCC